MTGYTQAPFLSRERFEKERSSFTGPEHVLQIQCGLDYIAAGAPPSTQRRGRYSRYSSHGLRLEVERWMKKRSDSPYDGRISNGALIAAAILARLAITQTASLNPVVHLGRRAPSFVAKKAQKRETDRQ
jgi:hypothetical protein